MLNDTDGVRVVCLLGSGIWFRDSFSVQGFGSGIYTWFRDLATSLRELYFPLRKSLSLKGIIFLILKISLKGRSGTKFMRTDVAFKFVKV